MTLSLSVIIPTLNESLHVKQAIHSAWAAGAAEVIVADGGSHDETTQLADESGCRVVASNVGRGPQQNAGAAMASGDVLLFLHADCRLHTSCGSQIQRALAAHPERLAGAFRQRIDGDARVYRWLERGNAARVRWRGMAYGDQGIFIRRDAFSQIGGFADVPIMEDVLLMRQVRSRSKVLLLSGPLFVSSRRWQNQGVTRQTLRNWLLLSAFQCGVSPDTLKHHYARHDQRGANGQQDQPS